MEYLTELWQSLLATLGNHLPRILGALGILVLGWIVAVVVRAGVRRGLGLVKLNERVKSEAGGKLDLQGGIASGAFYVVMLMTLIAFFNMLRLSLVSQPLQSLAEQILDFLPNLIAAGVLIIVAWVLATILKRVVTSGLSRTSLDEKLSDAAGMKPMSQNVGNVLYGLVLLLFLPAILGTLQLDGLLEPIQSMLDKILLMVPNIFAAALLGVVGWFVAGLLRNLMTNLLAAVGADRLGEKAGLSGSMKLSRLCGLLVFIFVFVPALIAALNALKLEPISRPATEMLGTFMSAIPNLFAATVILTLAFFISRLVGTLVTNLLGGIGFDKLPGAIGLGSLFPEQSPPSRIAGRIVVFFFMLFAVVESATLLGFTSVSELVSMFIEFGGKVLLGVAIIAIGLWLSNLAHGAISRMQRPNSGFMAGLARLAILGIVFAMGLRSMGIADDIVNLAFALTLGAVAVALALSFGLGGREAAGRQMEHWLSRFRQ